MLGLNIDCPICQGKQNNICKTCNGKGFIKKTLGIFPKYCSVCNKTGLVPCICSEEETKIVNILKNPDKISQSQKVEIIKFLEKYEQPFIVNLLEQYILQKSVIRASFIFEILSHFGWTPLQCKNETLKTRYALINKDKDYLTSLQHPIIKEINWYIGEYTDKSRIDFVIELYDCVKTPEMLDFCKQIIQKSRWQDGNEIINKIFSLIKKSEEGLELLVEIFETKRECFDICIRMEMDPCILKAIGRFAFKWRLSPNQEVFNEYIIKVLYYLGVKNNQEVIDISKELNKNKFSYSCALLSFVADLMMKQENNTNNLLDFIIRKKYYVEDPEKGLLETLSKHGDGGTSLLNTVLETYSYNSALRATNYLEYLITYRKEKLSQDSLAKISKLQYREFKSGGTSIRYMPGAFGGTYSSNSPEEHNILSFKHIVKKA